MHVIAGTLTHYRPAMPFGEYKVEDIFSTVLAFFNFKEYHPSGNMKFNNLDTFQSLKLRILMEIILPVSLKLNFAPNTLGCYGLKRSDSSHMD